jgi:hypothetical protein
MTLPSRPELSEPIPNSNFSYPEENFIKGPFWDMKLGEGLSIDENGSLQISGLPSESPSAFLYGPLGFLGVGSGLTLSSDSLIGEGV